MYSFNKKLKRGNKINIFNPLKLSNGTRIKNRIAKAVMEENLADYEHTSSKEIINLYKAWAQGGAGLIITGNVMIDRKAATGSGGIILEDEKHLDQFREWAKTITSQGLKLGANSKVFDVPREMTASEIEKLEK